MSTAQEIHVARHIGDDPETRKAAIAGLVDELAAGARDEGWPGMKFSTWASLDGNVWIAVQEAESFAGIEDLRVFRQMQKDIVADLRPGQQGDFAL